MSLKALAIGLNAGAAIAAVAIREAGMAVTILDEPEPTNLLSGLSLLGDNTVRPRLRQEPDSGGLLVSVRPVSHLPIVTHQALK